MEKIMKKVLVAIALAAAIPASAQTAFTDKRNS